MVATDYQQFLASKARRAPATGFSVAPEDLPAVLFPFQRDVTSWCLQRGHAAMFLERGLGKTVCQVTLAQKVYEHIERDVLILAPLGVTWQTRNEAKKMLGLDVTICRSQADVRPGINITNYEILDHFDAEHFGGVVLDEASILKSYMGKTKRALVESFRNTPYRLCCTATPAPNEIVELGNYAEFLGVMPANEMLTRWFINDTTQAQHFRLKGHAERDFWEWVATWAIALEKPSDLGYSDEGFTLPPLTIKHEIVEVDRTVDRGEQLMRTPNLSATTLHKEMRLTAAARAERVATIVNNSDDVFSVWCNTNYEADELKKRIPDAVEVRGSEPLAVKERKLHQFSNGEKRVIISKPSVCGYGLNWQHCHRMVILQSFSFEDFYQLIGRHHRYGQLDPVEAIVVQAETEMEIQATVERKMQQFTAMRRAMISSITKLGMRNALTLQRHETFTRDEGDGWELFHGDCVAVTRSLPEASVHFSIFSPPFSSLYSYSDAIEDMGNCADDREFFQHFDYLIPELLRITVPGRLCAVHCKNLQMYKSRYGVTGLRDFRGDIIRHFSAAGWVYHSEVCIWTDPVFEMQRTKAQRLLYKQVRQDATYSGMGMAEYLVIFRKWPRLAGEAEAMVPVTHDAAEFDLDTWQRYASPVWFDINRMNVLNAQVAREDRDEKHIAPLQLDIIERALDLWTNPGELVFDPFSGIGSTGVVCIDKGRRFQGSELKESYARQAVQFMNQAVRIRNQPRLFELDEVAS